MRKSIDNDTLIVKSFSFNETNYEDKKEWVLYNPSDSPNRLNRDMNKLPIIQDEGQDECNKMEENDMMNKPKETSSEIIMLNDMDNCQHLLDTIFGSYPSEVEDCCFLVNNTDLVTIQTDSQFEKNEIKSLLLWKKKNINKKLIEDRDKNKLVKSESPKLEKLPKSDNSQSTKSCIPQYKSSNSSRSTMIPVPKSAPVSKLVRPKIISRVPRLKIVHPSNTNKSIHTTSTENRNHTSNALQYAETKEKLIYKNSSYVSRLRQPTSGTNRLSIHKK